MCADLVIGALETALPRPQFAYLAPFRDQAKRVAWNYLKELTKDVWLKDPNESELRIDIRNGHGGEERELGRGMMECVQFPEMLRVKRTMPNIIFKVT